MRPGDNLVSLLAHGSHASTGLHLMEELLTALHSTAFVGMRYATKSQKRPALLERDLDTYNIA